MGGTSPRRRCANISFMSFVPTRARSTPSPTPPTMHPASTSFFRRPIFACTAMYEPRIFIAPFEYVSGKCSWPTSLLTVVRTLDVEITIVAGRTVPSVSSTPVTLPSRTSTRRTPVPVRTCAPSSCASRT